MKNVRNRINIKLDNNEGKLEKLIRQPNIKSIKTFSKDLLAFI